MYLFQTWRNQFHCHRGVTFIATESCRRVEGASEQCQHQHSASQQCLPQLRLASNSQLLTCCPSPLHQASHMPPPSQLAPRPHHLTPFTPFIHPLHQANVPSPPPPPPPTCTGYRIQPQASLCGRHLLHPGGRRADGSQWDLLHLHRDRPHALQRVLRPTHTPSKQRAWAEGCWDRVRGRGWHTHAHVCMHECTRAETRDGRQTKVLQYTSHVKRCKVADAMPGLSNPFSWLSTLRLTQKWSMSSKSTSACAPVVLSEYGGHHHQHDAVVVAPLC